MVTFNDQVEELVPSSQGKKKKKTKANEDANTKTLNSGYYELTAVNRENASAGQDTVDAVTQGKRRRRNLKQTPPTAYPLLLDTHCHNCRHKMVRPIRLDPEFTLFFKNYTLASLHFLNMQSGSLSHFCFSLVTLFTMNFFNCINEHNNIVRPFQFLSNHVTQQYLRQTN